MNEQVEYNAELNGIVLEYTEMLSTMQKLIFDYTNAKTDEAKDFIVKQETFTTLKQAERFMELISTTFPAAS